MNYPHAPGFKAEGPSRESAEIVTKRAMSLREHVAKMFMLDGRFTADELARLMNKSILSVRPRVAELVAQGKLKDTGLRRPNASGHRATVWQWVHGGER